MGLATAALVHGDGDWENIQEVLRAAFLAHDEQLQTQSKRIETNEQRAAELSAANTASVAQFEGLRGHIDALARVVNTLSEELKQRTQEEQERRQQLKAWMDSIARTVETQIHSVQSRISDVENACIKALEKIEHRMELMEEELGHFVDALEQKADLNVVQTHRKAVEEALKLRCRKAAFDKEVQRVHQLLRSQMSTTTERLELMRSELMDELQKQQQRQVETIQDTETREIATQKLREEITSEIERSQRQALAVCGDELTTLKTELQLRVAEAVSAQGETLSKRLTEMRFEGQRVEQLVETVEGTVALKAQELREWVEPKIAKLEQQQSEAQMQLLARIDGSTSHLKDELALLQTKLEEVAQHTAETLQQQTRDVETRQIELADEWREGLKAREKKTRQQMHLVADKLSEMDQILKLVGKQLVQNTSQVQLLWSEQQEQRALESGDVGFDAMIEEGERLLAEELPVEAGNEDLLVRADDVDAAARRISQHQQLQDSIEAKLRDYEEVLLPQRHSLIPPEAT